MGINVDTTISFTFLLGGLMAGAAGLIYALYQTTVWYFQGFTAGLIAFTAAVMGGIGNISGAVLGGLIIGCIQQISDNRIGAEWTPVRRVRLPDRHHGLPPARPAGRGDAGGGVSVTVGRVRGFKHINLSIAIVLLTVAALFPLTRPPLDSFVDDCILALAYVVMALGLNIVVGFAGLLDLGYVAFYAFGAYAVGWFASDFFSKVNGEKGVHVLVGPFPSSLPGDPPQLPLHPRGGARPRRAGGDRHRAADAAPARRLHRDRHAGLRRDHRALRGQRRRHRGQRLQADQRAPGDLPGRPDRPPGDQGSSTRRSRCGPTTGSSSRWSPSCSS